MGICSSSSARSTASDPAELSQSVYKLMPEMDKYRAEFERMTFSESDLTRLHETFKEIDTDKSNTLDVGEMIQFMRKQLGEENFPTAFAHKLFSAFDEDMDGEVDFHEFVVALFNYCTLEPPAVITFAFDLYDSDGNGSIDPNELQALLQDVYGRPVKAREMLQLLQPVLAEDINDSKTSSDSSSDRRKSIAMATVRPLGLHEFVLFCQAHPEVLKQVLGLQIMLQQQCNGLKFWVDKRKSQDAASPAKLNTNSKRVYPGGAEHDED